MDKAPAYGAGDSGFESRYGLLFCFCTRKSCSIRHFAWMKLGFRSNPWRTARQLFSREQASKKLARIVRDTNSLRRKKAPEVRLELTTYRLTAGRATDCAIQELLHAMEPRRCQKTHELYKTKKTPDRVPTSVTTL